MFFSSSDVGETNPNDTVINGTPGDDNLTGGQGGSTIIGQDGNDVLLGGSGSNILQGDAGNDTLTGGSGSNDITGGTGNDVLTGGSGGTGGNDFDGGAGEDRLVGGTGSNNLTGGSEADTFFFSKVVNVAEGSVIINGETVIEGDESNNPINTIADFNTSEGDRIELDATSFGIAPGDTSTLTFDNDTQVLSVGDDPVVEVIDGLDSDVLANTAIVENGDTTATNSEVVEGVDNNDGILDVYRFFETEKGFHFYTSSETEKDAVQQQIDNNELAYSYEGESFAALAEDDDGDPLTGAKPVYRFFNNLTGAHLYTISEAEKNNIVDNLPDYNLEGIAYYAYDEAQENTIPLYRLYNGETGTHFFTPSATEKDSVLEALPQYNIEGNDGVAFHVLPIE